MPNSDTNGLPLYVPGQVSITWSPLIYQRRKDIWGEDVDEFKPERWLHESAKEAKRNGYFTPFHAGPRTVSGLPMSKTGYYIHIIVLTRNTQSITIPVPGAELCLHLHFLHVDTDASTVYL